MEPKTLTQIRQTPHEQLHIVLGTVNDKNIEKLLAILPKMPFIISVANIPRAMPKEILFLLLNNTNSKAKNTLVLKQH